MKQLSKNESIKIVVNSGVEQEFECTSNSVKILIISNFSCRIKGRFSSKIKIEFVLMQGKILTKGKYCGKLVL